MKSGTKIADKFHQYQSLGNDFLLLDWLEVSLDEIQSRVQAKNWSEQVKRWCDRQSGIGADGVLVMMSAENFAAETLIFNSDGTAGAVCLNGVRCVARFLRDKDLVPKIFALKMSTLIIPCEVDDDEIKITVSSAPHIETCEITVADKVLKGFRVEAGNPHFIVFRETTEDWLKEHGYVIETDAAFPNRTNVEFVWKDDEQSQVMAMPVYRMLIHERGCGMTKACGSGAAAVMDVLLQSHKIRINHQVVLSMPGGNLISFIDDNLAVIQFADAKQIS